MSWFARIFQLMIRSDLSTYRRKGRSRQFIRWFPILDFGFANWAFEVTFSRLFFFSKPNLLVDSDNSPSSPLHVRSSLLIQVIQPTYCWFGAHVSLRSSLCWIMSQCKAGQLHCSIFSLLCAQNQTKFTSQKQNEWFKTKPWRSCYESIWVWWWECLINHVEFVEIGAGLHLMQKQLQSEWSKPWV
jgi:hypothetical protein